ncbi:LytTR family DNA-binding domain-containing protein [Chryseobacterium sp. C39-AII1]|uniref:LytR/AlgR family response regulator transcription factor n=1 Tax=Chryseobacterium sp. C39-AII1 TaxID=3080332 RepID=UPI003209FFE9
MKIIIIEDELLVAEDLAGVLRELRPNIEITAILTSVKEAILYLNNNEAPDLIFSDIQLGDGLSFEIAKSVNLIVPVIFCTAFDIYALEAFRANGIEYILKPFSTESLSQALNKYEYIQKAITRDLAERYESALATISAINNNAVKTLLVRYRDRLLPFTVDKIAFFCVENDLCYLHHFSSRTFIVNESLEELESKLGNAFFRVNRQYLVNRKAIQDVSEYFPRKLRINLYKSYDKDIVVSKEKKTKFIKWLGA